MDKARFSFAWVTAVIALLAYSYISFMGLIYCQFLPVIYCAAAAVLFDVITVLLISLMSRAKQSRWRRIGLLGQGVIGFVVLAMLLASSVAFSHFNNIIRQKDEIRTAYSSAIADSRSLGEKYERYVDERCQRYASSLQRLTAGSREYDALFGNSLSLQLSKEAIIGKCTQNLRKLLKGNNNDDLLQKREKWLENESASVWNLSLPANIRDITLSVNKWLDNYRELSSVSYTGELNAVPFKDTDFNANINELATICRSLEIPSFVAVLLALLSYALILLPWIVTPRNMATVGGGFDDVVVEMPEDDE